MYKFYLTHSLEKVFPDTKAKNLEDDQLVFKGLIGDRINFQLVHYLDTKDRHTNKAPLRIGLKDYDGQVETYSVELLPSNYPAVSALDDNYLRTFPGLFPDLLSPIDSYFQPMPDQYRAIWFSLPLKDKGSHKLTIEIFDDVNRDQYFYALANNQEYKHIENPASAKAIFSKTLTIEVADLRLEKEGIKHTEWFHGDCLADYYGVEVFSDKHWQIMENFIEFASKRAEINMLLTPIFTPPLDIFEGGERTTIQLIQINKTDESYEFNFDNLRKWCRLCKKHNIKYLEISHLFSQWGAKYTPKVIVNYKGEDIHEFGWHEKSNSPKYRAFLEKLLPALTKVLKEEGYNEENTFFHISDEPSMEDLNKYKNARDSVKDLLEGYKIIDALSNFDFYEKGVVDNPIPSNDHIEEFYKANIKDLWVYYCISQNKYVPNRFFAMPSTRNRVMGLLMYLYNIKGFLHWGYNFYNSQYSIRPLNPFIDTDADKGFFSGDAFLVYPGDDLRPISSIRNEIQVEAFNDFYLLNQLERQKGRKFVEAIIYQDFDSKMTFTNYPKEAQYFLKLKNRLVEELTKI